MVKQLMIIPLVLAMLFVPFAGAEEAPTCNGLIATIVGTEGDDMLDGTNAADVIVGLGGNDVIRAFNGDDTICVGDGDNQVLAHSGDDIVIASPTGSLIALGYGGYDVIYAAENTVAKQFEEIRPLETKNVEIIEPPTETVLTVTTDKTQYRTGETITISGTVMPIIENLSITVEVMGSDATIVHRDNIDIVRLDGAFASLITDNALATSKYIVTATTPTGLSETTEFLVQQDPVTTMQIDNNLPAIGEEITITGTATGVLIPQEYDILLDVLSPSGESLLDIRPRVFSSAIDADDGTFSKSIPIQRNLAFFENAGQYQVQAFLVLSKDLSPPQNIPRGPVLATIPFSILDFQPAVGTLDFGTPILIKQPNIVLPDPTTAETSNVAHFLQVPITNNQNKDISDFASIILLQTPSDPEGSEIIQMHRLLEVGQTVEIRSGFIPNEPGQIISTFTLVNNVTDRVPLLETFTETVTITGVVTNPELTRQELSDKVTLLEATLADVLARLAALEG